MIIISRYSGKCDLADHFEGKPLDVIKKYKIYVGNSEEPIEVKDETSLIPYYPYTISLGYFNNTEGKSVIRLSSESFVDREEREILEFRLKELLRIYNRCKRKKIEFTAEDAVKEVCCFGWDEEVYRELANRVKDKGKKASVEGIHLKVRERYRKELVDEMLKRGLNPANYGYERFVKGGV